MTRLYGKMLLAENSADEFVGRSRELEMLLEHARVGSFSRGLILLSPPAAGTSELLRQTYDELFKSGGDVIPFYFALKKSDRSASQAALRFLQQFLLMAVAYRRRDTGILDASPEICELSQLAPPSDGYWIDRLIETCGIDSRLNDERSFVRNCLSAPLRAAARGANVFVMVDDIHEAAWFDSSVNILDEFRDIYSRAAIPFVFAGRRRFDHGMNSFRAQFIEPLNFTNTGQLAEQLGKKYNVHINDQTRDLMATQFRETPMLIRSLFEAAAEKRRTLDSFQRLEQTYIDGLIGGSIGRFFKKELDDIAPSAERQTKIIEFLFDGISANNAATLRVWQRHLGIVNGEFRSLAERLNASEFVRVSSNHIEINGENSVLADYVTARYRMDVATESSGIVFGEILANALKRAPQILAKLYRRNSSLGLSEIMSAFDCQEVPLGLIDYGRFREAYKGASEDKIAAGLAAETEKVSLPQTAYVTSTAEIYPAIGQFIDEERSAVATGFRERNYTDDDQTAWLAAEIESKLEADRELAEFWCDRLEMAALMCGFSSHRIWLIAPEGFSEEALDALRERNAIGSSRRQAVMLKAYLAAESISTGDAEFVEYEMIVPMGDDTELIAAHTVEEIARRHDFPAKAINQIKTALVEACINAAEHSSSPDRRIYQKFAVYTDRLVVTISNRGLRLLDRKAVESDPSSGRRGWGLNLMRGLMDEVKLESVDDGTRITMTKYLEKTQTASNA